MYGDKTNTASVLFKYVFTSYVDRKISEKIKWAATARVSQEAGFRGVLIIRYSIVPPRTLLVHVMLKY